MYKFFMLDIAGKTAGPTCSKFLQETPGGTKAEKIRFFKILNPLFIYVRIFFPSFSNSRAL